MDFSLSQYCDWCRFPGETAGRLEIYKGDGQIRRKRGMRDAYVPPSAMERTLLSTSQSVILSAGMGLFTPLVAAW